MLEENTMDVEDYSLETLYGHLMSCPNGKTYGMEGLSIFRKRENDKVKTITISLDPGIYSGLILEINRKWFNKYFIESPQVIEETCRFILYRIVARHLINMMKTPIWGDKFFEWEDICSLGSQISSASMVKDNIRENKELMDIHPEKLKMPDNQSMDDYIRLLIKSSSKLKKAIGSTPLGKEDFSKAGDTSKGNLTQCSLQAKMEMITTKVARNLAEKNIGDLPSSLDLLIKDILEPHHDLPWTRLFENQIANGLEIRDIKSYSHIDRKKLALIGMGLDVNEFLCLPGVKNDRGPVIVVLVDESGSISNKELTDALGVVVGLVTGIEGALIVIVPFDIDPGKPYEIKSVEDFKKKIRKRNFCGGTSFVTPLLWVTGKKEYKKKSFEYEPSTVIIITDGYGPAPSRSQLPKDIMYIWLMACSDNSTMPYIESRGDLDYGYAIWTHSGDIQCLGS